MQSRCFLDSVSQSSADTNKCIQKGMGYQQGAMVKGGTVVTYKCIGTESNKIRTFDLQKIKISETSSFSNRQHRCTTLPCENWGNREPNVTEIKQRNFAVSLETPDYFYCRILSKFFQCRARLAVSKQQGSIRMESLAKSILITLPEERNI